MTTSHLTWLAALFDEGHLHRQPTPQQASFARLMSPGRCPRLLHDVCYESLCMTQSHGGRGHKNPRFRLPRTKYNGRIRFLPKQTATCFFHFLLLNSVLSKVFSPGSSCQVQRRAALGGVPLFIYLFILRNSMKNRTLKKRA